ncbi:AT-rich interactive domain-containing protein 6-like [Curcuma longa]|uniref:AT-rich interactive domain-containing protein 6-like n=1 Tax=Curcuma longa TaxID=136217 RepID=UPI003D9F9FA4
MELDMDGALVEKETDSTLTEMQMDNQMTVTMRVNSGFVNPFWEQNLAEKSDKANGMSLEEKSNCTTRDDKTDGTLMEMQTDNQMTVTMRVDSGSIHPFLEHSLVENFEKTDDTLLEKKNVGTLPEKAINDTLLVIQTESCASESFQASVDNYLVEKSDNISYTPLVTQAHRTLFEMQTDLILMSRQIDDNATVPAAPMEIDSDKRSIIDLKTGEMEEAVAPLSQNNIGTVDAGPVEASSTSFSIVPYSDGDCGTEEEQAAFLKELEDFYWERKMKFKPPKFYGELVNCLKLWRVVTRLGGYDQVTACRFWRRVGESFNPPKNCTSISWSFRNFYEKTLFEYEKHKIQTGEFKTPMVNLSSFASYDNQVGVNQASGSVGGKRDAAAQAMEVWFPEQLLDTKEAGDPMAMDNNFTPFSMKDKQGKLKKRKPPPTLELFGRDAMTAPVNTQGVVMVDDVGSPADWVTINVQKKNDFFEIYALIPGLLREEVQVQSEPSGRLIISGKPEHPDNPWGVTPFKKVITLPTRIDPYQTSAVVTLHGQLYVRAPIDFSDT